MWENFFYFTKREKSGLIFLIILIAGIFAGKFFLGKPENQLPEELRIETENTIGNSTAATSEQERQSSYDKPDNNSYNNPYNNPNKNTRNNLNNRSSSSNRKNPGNPSSQSNQSNKQDEKRTYFNNQQNNSYKTNDSIRNTAKIDKLDPGSKIDLNTADTTLMMRVPGIGQTYAVRILKYRKILGGYYSVEQLKEVYNMYEELYEKIIPYFNISQQNRTLIYINKTSLDQLRAHPYIDFYQAKAIVELRKKNGNISTIEALTMLEEFPPEAIEKIRHYLSFE